MYGLLSRALIIQETMPTTGEWTSRQLESLLLLSEGRPAEQKKTLAIYTLEKGFISSAYKELKTSEKKIK